MKLLSIIVALCYSFSFAYAAPPTDAEVVAMIDASDISNQIVTLQNEVRGTVASSMQSAVKGMKLNSEQERTVAARVDAITATALKAVSYEKIREELIPIYKDLFNAEEVDGIAEFYRSPAGKAFFRKLPQVSQRFGAVIKDRLTPVYRDMKSEIATTVAEIKAGK